MHGRTDKQTERQKLYIPRHTSYAEGIMRGSQCMFLTRCKKIIPGLSKTRFLQKVVSGLSAHCHKTEIHQKTQRKFTQPANQCLLLNSASCSQGGETKTSLYLELCKCATPLSAAMIHCVTYLEYSCHAQHFRDILSNNILFPGIYELQELVKCNFIHILL